MVSLLNGIETCWGKIYDQLFDKDLGLFLTIWVKEKYDFMLPFLKWPGGKRWLVPLVRENFPVMDGKYLEPFLGGGAVFFGTCPQSALLSDINDELIETYHVMRDDPCGLRERLKYHQKRHDKDYYYKVRNQRLRKPVNRAGRFIYLNRTCFNGIYRVNKRGKFNVPKGSKDLFIDDIDLFEQYADILRCVEIVNLDFEKTIVTAQRGDFLFVDPPYAMKSNQQFVKYNNKLFSWEDQERLHESLVQAKERGVNILLTNANCEEIKNMYKDAGFCIKTILRNCIIAGKAEKRSNIQELIISTREIKIKES